ncbi:MAG: ArsB/NhaD family transporter [Planctomycetota bacterium]|jgi:Na+/H+ antiporter NhaD/arsenite permease-like protein
MEDSFMFWFGTIIFLLTYIGIAFDKKTGIDKTAVALFGSSLMLFFILRPETESASAGVGAYSKYVDFNVIFLLAGMMVIVNVLTKTGVFQYLAIWSAKIAKGYPIYVLLLLVSVTAVLSSSLDNVTTVLLIAPVTLLVAEQLGVNAAYFLLPEVVASNIGGTATLIGDPPNILIGSYVGLDFVDFLINLAPVVIVAMGIYVLGLYVFLRKEMTVGVEKRAQIMDLNEKRAITDMKLLKKTGVVLGITMIGFLLHGAFHLEPGVVAMGGAALLLVVTRADTEKVLEEVEWTTLFFFMGLFIVVNGAIHVGFIDKLAGAINPLIADSPYVAALIVLWGGALCAGIMNNVSFTAAALPIIAKIAAQLNLEGDMATPIWWALALGACLGGNLTPVGAAANVIVLDIARKNGHNFSFGKFMRWSVPITLISLIISSLWVMMLVWKTVK